MYNIIWDVIIAVVVSYLLGSIPTAYLVGRAIKGVDIRTIGSRNMGAMNAFYAIGFWPGMGVLACDIAKGMLAIYSAYLLSVFILPVDAGYVIPLEMLAGIAVIAGHNFTVWLKFKGGKGGATAIGVLAFMLAWVNWVELGSVKLPIPYGWLIYLACFFTLMALTRWPTAAYGISFFAFPFIAWYVYKDAWLTVYSVFIGLVPILMYIPRIKQILGKSGGNLKRAVFRKNLKDRM